VGWGGAQKGWGGVHKGWGIALSGKISRKISKWGLRGKHPSNFEKFS
jgi:hypothetical protein